MLKKPWLRQLCLIQVKDIKTAKVDRGWEISVWFIAPLNPEKEWAWCCREQEGAQFWTCWASAGGGDSQTQEADWLQYLTSCKNTSFALLKMDVTLANGLAKVLASLTCALVQVPLMCDVCDDSSAVCSEPAGCVGAAPGCCRAGTQAETAGSEELLYLTGSRNKRTESKTRRALNRRKAFLSCLHPRHLLVPAALTA